MFLPRIAPLDRDAIADEQHVDGAFILVHGLHMRLVELEPRIATKKTGARRYRPKLRQMLVRLATGTAVVLCFLGDVGPLLPL